MSRQPILLGCVLACAVSLHAGAVCAAPLVIPFDFSRSVIGVNASIKGTAIHALVDTGVDPSVIDLALADKVGLKVDRKGGGEMSGVGNARHASAFPSRIEGLSIAGRAFSAFDTLASDTTGLSKNYGRPLAAVLGYSFLADKIVLIDYPRRTLGLLDGTADAAPMVSTCRTRWTTPLQTYESFPIIARFRFGPATGPISLDTGSNGGVSFYQSALSLPDVRAALTRKGAVAVAGARGTGKAESYTFNAPVGFGPFAAPAGQVVTVRADTGSATTRVANVGNKLFAALKLKMLLDYRHRSMTFYGDCG